jgi:hypothetical protein
MGVVNVAIQKVKEAVKPRLRSQDIAAAYARQKEESAERARALLDDDSPANAELYNQSKERETRLEAQLRAATDLERKEREDAERERLAPLIAAFEEAARIASESWANAQFQAHIVPKLDRLLDLAAEIHRDFEALIAEQAKAVERARELAPQVGRNRVAGITVDIGHLYELARRNVRARLIADIRIPDHLANLLAATRG